MQEIIKDIELLREPAEQLTFIKDDGIETEEGNKIISELKEIMEADKNILCLAAPQIGIKKRIFCIRFNDFIKVFINPIITKKSGCSVAPETFLNFEGKEILIARPDEITVVYYNEEYKYEDNKLLGSAARIFDQMAQLLDGILPDELGLVSSVEEDGSLSELNEDEIKQILEIYRQFISKKTKTLTEDINKDKTDSAIYKNLLFTEHVISGRIQALADEPAQNAKIGSAANKFNKAKNQANLKTFLANKR